MGGIERIYFFEDQLQELEQNTRQYTEKSVSKLSCKNYGFDCNFKTNGKDVGKIVKDFREHTLEEHYIDYPEGVLMKTIMKKNNFKNYSDNVSF